MKDIDRVLLTFLSENSNINESKYNEMTQSEKTDYLRELALSIMGTLSEKIKNIDTKAIDRSKGDIKQLESVKTANEAIEKLKRLAGDDKILKNSIETIDETIDNLVKFVVQFRDAYRNNKTFLILQYQTLAMNIVIATQYIITCVIDPKTNEVKKSYEIEEINALTAMKQFNKTVQSGEFNKMLKDLQVMHEEFDYTQNEFDQVLKTGNIVEAISMMQDTLNQPLNEDDIDDLSDTVSNVFNSLKNGISNIAGKGGGNLINTLYKSAGAVALMMALRDSVSTVSNMAKTIKNNSLVNNFTKNISSFVNNDNNAQMTQSSFDRLNTNIEVADELSNREIESQNKEIIRNAAMGSAPTISAKSELTDADLGNMFNF